MEKEFEPFRDRMDALGDLVKWVQVDVVDGVFASGKSFELEQIKKYEDGFVRLWDVHLLVKEPINWVEKSDFSGASRITGQVEMMGDGEEFIKKIHERGIEAGLAFDIETEIEEIPEETEVVLLMGRKAGFVPIDLDERIWGRIEKLKEIKNDGRHKFVIGVDGGINRDNILELKAAGVEIAYCTGAVFNGKVEENIRALNDLIKDD